MNWIELNWIKGGTKGVQSTVHHALSVILPSRKGSLFYGNEEQAKHLIAINDNDLFKIGAVFWSLHLHIALTTFKIHSPSKRIGCDLRIFMLIFSLLNFYISHYSNSRASKEYTICNIELFFCGARMQSIFTWPDYGYTDQTFICVVMRSSIFFFTFLRVQYPIG